MSPQVKISTDNSLVSIQALLCICMTGNKISNTLVAIIGITALVSLIPQVKFLNNIKNLLLVLLTLMLATGFATVGMNLWKFSKSVEIDVTLVVFLVLILIAQIYCYVKWLKTQYLETNHQIHNELE